MTIESRGAVRAGVVDLTEFAVGSERSAIGKEAPGEKRQFGKWVGGFKGRPELIRQLAPILADRWAHSPRPAMTGGATSLRAFWRHLDSLTSHPVQRLQDIQQIHGTSWIQSGCSPHNYNPIKSWLREARARNNLSVLQWPPFPRNSDAADLAPPLPPFSAFKRLYHALKGEAQEIFDRWEVLDLLEPLGTDILAIPTGDRPTRIKVARAWSPARIAVTVQLLKYHKAANDGTSLDDDAQLIGKLDEIVKNHPYARRFAGRDRNGNLMPSDRLISLAHFIKTTRQLAVTKNKQVLQASEAREEWSPDRWFADTDFPPIQEVWGLPNRRDVAILFWLFLLLSGWNPQVALDMGIHPESELFLPVPLYDEYIEIVARKVRAGGAPQSLVTKKRLKFGPYQILKTLIARTETLRDIARYELQGLRSAEALGEDEPADEWKIDSLRRLIGSPWILLGRIGDEAPNHLDPSGFGNIHFKLSDFIDEANEKERLRRERLNIPPCEPIPNTIVATDFRDGFLHNIWLRSNGNWLLGSLALGHRSASSLKRYVRHAQYRVEGENKVVEWQNAVWRQVKDFRVLEPAFLYSELQGGRQPSAEERQRWFDKKLRTRVGTGCRDFNNPPPEIAPNHVAGSGCRFQRCTICPLAVIFDDSLPHLARRMAELEWLKVNLSLESFERSLFKLEYETAFETLGHFDAAEVNKWLETWRGKIASGEHRVPQFDGEYEA